MSGLIGGPIGFGLPLIMRLELALPGFILSPYYIINSLFFTLFKNIGQL